MGFAGTASSVGLSGYYLAAQVAHALHCGSHERLSSAALPLFPFLFKEALSVRSSQGTQHICRCVRCQPTGTFRNSAATETTTSCLYLTGLCLLHLQLQSFENCSISQANLFGASFSLLSMNKPVHAFTTNLHGYRPLCFLFAI